MKYKDLQPGGSQEREEEKNYGKELEAKVRTRTND